MKSIRYELVDEIWNIELINFNFPFHLATIEIFYIIKKELEIELN
jgi:hypothetical protein